MAEPRGRIVVLFGAPAVGKDTVSGILSARDSRYQQFVKHKCGSGSRHGYTIVSEMEIQELRNAGRLLSEVDRYGSTYAVERRRLDESVAANQVVLIHSAEPAEVHTLIDLGATLVLLECSRETAYQRLQKRDPATARERLEVWDLISPRLDFLEPIAAIRLLTDNASPDEIADQIEEVLFRTDRG